MISNSTLKNIINDFENIYNNTAKKSISNITFDYDIEHVSEAICLEYNVDKTYMPSIEFIKSNKKNRYIR